MTISTGLLNSRKMISTGLLNWQYLLAIILALCYLVAEVHAGASSSSSSKLNNFDEISSKGGKKSSSGQSKEVVESMPHWSNAPDVASAIQRSFEG